MHSSPLWGMLLILAGLLVGWFAWGTHTKIDTNHENMAPVEGPAGIVGGDTTAPIVAEPMHVNLSDKTGKEFDKAFLEEMIAHHQAAVDMAKLVLAKSERPDLIVLAGEIIAAQTKEIEMMKKWHEDWFE